MNIDFIRTSASRPELLIESTESIKKHLKFYGEIRFMLHEDTLNFDSAQKVMQYARNCDFYDKVVMDDPPISQGKSIDRLYKMVNTEYFIHWEDDFKLERELNLDICVKIMQENKDVNQIAFNKRGTMATIGEPVAWVKKEVERSGYKLVTSPHWRLTPAIWRKSFIDKFWSFGEKILTNRAFNWLLNDKLKGIKTDHVMRDADWIIENLGCYYMGRIGEPPYVSHIGTGKSIRERQYKWE